MHFPLVFFALVVLGGLNLLIQASPTRGQTSRPCARSSISTVTVTTTRTVVRARITVTDRTVATTTVTAATSTDLRSTVTTITTCLRDQETVQKRFVPRALAQVGFGGAGLGASFALGKRDDGEESGDGPLVVTYHPTVSIASTVTDWAPGCATDLPDAAPEPPVTPYTSTPAESTSPSETITPVESTSSSETVTPVESEIVYVTSTVLKSTSRSETVTPVESEIVSVTVTSTPVESTSPLETVTPVESEIVSVTVTSTPVESTSPLETVTPVESEIVSVTSTVVKSTSHIMIFTSQSVTPTPVKSSTVFVISTSQPVTSACLWIATHTVTISETVTLSPVITSVKKATRTATTTPSTKKTTTLTATSIFCAAPTTCTNQGLQWAYYPSLVGPNRDNYYSNFDPVLYKTIHPRDQGMTHSIGGISHPIAGSDGFIEIYDSPNHQSRTFFALNHKGYIYAVTTGLYTFSTSSVDDTVYLWLGPHAYSGWDAANANLHVSWVQESADGVPAHPGSGSATFFMVGGEYYPFRIMYGQAQTAAEFWFQVTEPDGSVFLDRDTVGSPYVVQYSCDGGESAPPFSFFGAEDE